MVIPGLLISNQLNQSRPFGYTKRFCPLQLATTYNVSLIMVTTISQNFLVSSKRYIISAVKFIVDFETKIAFFSYRTLIKFGKKHCEKKKKNPAPDSFNREKPK